MENKTRDEFDRFGRKLYYIFCSVCNKQGHVPFIPDKDKVQICSRCHLTKVNKDRGVI